MNRYTDGSRLVSNRTCDRLTDPPCCIGTELKSLLIIKLLYRLDKSKVSFLYKIQKQHTTSHVTLCNADYQSQVSFCKTLFRFFITICHSLCQLDLFFCRKKRNLTDLLQIHTDRIFDADSVRNRQVDLLHIHFVFIRKHDLQIIIIHAGVIIHLKHIDPIGLQVLKYLVHLCRFQLHIPEYIIDFLDFKNVLLFLRKSNQIF